MMQFIKFTMSKGESITLPKEQAERLIDSEGQLLKIPDENGSWSGKLINKAHIVSTDRDKDREIIEINKLRDSRVKLNQGRPTHNQIKKAEAIKEKIRKRFNFKKK